MDTNWDEEFDVVIVGSGGGGLVAALKAAEEGLKPLILEKQEYVGGSTAMSGGNIWLPNNPLMQAEGLADSREEGHAYFDAVVGDVTDVGEYSSFARRDAYLRVGEEVIAFLQRKGMRFSRCVGYSDFFDLLPGGQSAGRSIECEPWDGRQLGDWREKIMPGMAKNVGLVVTTAELRYLPVFTRSPRAFCASARVLLRTWKSRLLRQDLWSKGMALVGQLTKCALDAGVPIWLDTGVDELIVENGRVCGVRARRAGVAVTIRGRRGVLLSAGGFEHNAEMRRKHSGDQPNEGKWTIANPGNTGEVLSAAIAVGAQTDLMDEAWWIPVPRPELAGSTLSTARALPRTILVNSKGERFCNEANSFMEIGKAMYANDGLPAWLIFDDGYRRRYPLASGLKKISELHKALPGRMPSEWIENRWIIRADTISDLARQIGVDPDKLAATVHRFNIHASQDEDPDFGRGRSAYNRWLGDPGEERRKSGSGREGSILRCSLHARRRRHLRRSSDEY